MSDDAGEPAGTAPSASYTITARAQYPNRPGMLGMIASAIGDAGGDIGGVDLVRTDPATIVRDITIGARDDEHRRAILDVARELKGVTVRRGYEPVFRCHGCG